MLRTQLPGAVEMLVAKATGVHPGTRIRLLAVFARARRALWLHHDCERHRDFYRLRAGRRGELDATLVEAVETLLREAYDQPGPLVFTPAGEDVSDYVGAGYFRDLLLLHDGASGGEASAAEEPEADTPAEATSAISRFAQAIMQRLVVEAADGAIPYAVTSFTDLHDYTEANTLLDQVGLSYDPDDPASLDDINAVTNEVTRRLQAGELTGGGWHTMSWTTTVDHRVTVPNRLVRPLFGLPPEAPIRRDWWVYPAPDESLLAGWEEMHHHVEHTDRALVDIASTTERLLTADEVAAIGHDPHGQDGHPGFPHRWSTLTRDEHAALERMGATADRAADLPGPDPQAPPHAAHTPPG